MHGRFNVRNPKAGLSILPGPRTAASSGTKCLMKSPVGSACKIHETLETWYAAGSFYLRALTIGIEDPEVWAGINAGGCTPLPDGGKVYESEPLKVNLFK
jgi:hypothetical protein